MTATSPDADRALSVAREAAMAGGNVALSAFRTPLRITPKASKMDPVTQADIDAQSRVVEVIHDAFPDHTIVGEEGDQLKAIPETGHAWVIDPIDGTNNFTHGNRIWATCLAYVVDGTPQVAVTRLPAFGDEYVAASETLRDNDPVRVSTRDDPEFCTVSLTFGLQREHRPLFGDVSRNLLETFGDLRRFGTGQVSLAMVAAGELDGAVSAVHLSPWDTVAGVHLVEQAGGKVTDINGNPWRWDADGLVASNGEIHDDLLSIIP
ncbi:inositol monophosphatase family protein [Haladaptatus sp. GCM10025707]|uniref:inositol monophosphatase family protein n=1 Tax=unclassified Haladaptatus TaxID=2622732 RepID=UPI0023E79D2F|nr:MULTISPECIES: inositol monophosphatase [unclassified Haladaptatus]